MLATVDSMFMLHVGRFDRKRLGRLGQLHRLASACVRERARSARPRWILGSRWVHRRRQCGELQAPTPDRAEARLKEFQSSWGQILAYMAFCEVSQDQSPGTPAAAGDFGFKVLTSSDPAEKTKKLSAELANGRLAMMAIIGMFFQASSG